MRRALAAIALAAICIAGTLPVRAQQVAFVAAVAHGEPFVAVATIAQKLGWTFTRTPAGAIVDDGTGPQTLRVGSRLVSADGADLQLFASPLVDRDGRLSLTISDAATLFHLDVRQDGTHLALVTPPESDAEVREVPRPATPAPAAPPQVAQADATPPPLVAGNAGTLSVSVQFDGSARTYQTNLSGNAGIVHGALSSYGDQALQNPAGAVTIGNANRGVALGSIDDPFSGSVIAGGSLTGAAAHAAGDGRGYGLSAGNGVNGNVYAASLIDGNVTDTLGYVSGVGARNQPLLRSALSVPQTWGVIERETLIGTQGVAEGLHARTTGKTFFDGTFSTANGTLPLMPGDLPTGAVIGERLGPVTTLSAGYVRSLDAPGSPTFGVATRVGRLNLSANVSQHWTNLSANYASGNAYGILFASAGVERLFGLNGGITAGKLLAEVQLNGSAGTSSGLAQLRTNHAGLNLAAGLDLNAGAVRPLVGIVAPLAPALALEVGLAQAPSGKPGLRIALLAGFRQAKPHVTTYPVTVDVADAAQYGPLRVFVDGVRDPQPYDAATPLRIAAGRHTISAESSDQHYASNASDVLVGPGQTAREPVRLALLPQRAVSGTVSVGGTDGTSLEGIRVVLEPSGESATTDAAGHFAFARAPYASESTLLLDPATVPSAFACPGSIAVGTGPVTVALEPARKVERTTFR